MSSRSLTYNEVAKTYLVAQNTICSIFLILFGSWHWFNLFKYGCTSIEMLKGQEEKERFTLGNYRENLYLRFGNTQLWRCIMPFQRIQVPINGLEWSFNKSEMGECQSLIETQ